MLALFSVHVHLLKENESLAFGMTLQSSKDLPQELLFTTVSVTQEGHATMIITSKQNKHIVMQRYSAYISSADMLRHIMPIAM
jgi:hypothetical protein